MLSKSSRAMALRLLLALQQNGPPPAPQMGRAVTAGTSWPGQYACVTTCLTMSTTPAPTDSDTPLNTYVTHGSWVACRSVRAPAQPQASVNAALRGSQGSTSSARRALAACAARSGTRPSAPRRWKHASSGCRAGPWRAQRLHRGVAPAQVPHQNLAAFASRDNSAGIRHDMEAPQAPALGPRPPQGREGAVGRSLVPQEHLHAGARCSCKHPLQHGRLNVALMQSTAI